jgi:hypothetical protein
VPRKLGEPLNPCTVWDPPLVPDSNTCFQRRSLLLRFLLDSDWSGVVRQRRYFVEVQDAIAQASSSSGPTGLLNLESLNFANGSVPKREQRALCNSERELQWFSSAGRWTQFDRGDPFSNSYTFSLIELRISLPLAGANKIPTPMRTPTPAAKVAMLRSV